MPRVLVEEHHHYEMDCTNAVWASDEMHSIYHRCGLPGVLCDADFVVETNDFILLVEYKNASIPEAVGHATEDKEYNPFEDKKFDKIVRKFCDSLHYLRLVKKEKPVQYIFVLEYPKGDSVSRKLLRNRLKKRLPFKLQEQFEKGIELINAVEVVNINEWNSHNLYGQFPIRPVNQQIT